MLLKVVNPSTEQVVAELEQASAKAVSDAVKRARAAQPKWAARPLAERISIFETFRQKVAEGVEDLAKVLSTTKQDPEIGPLHEFILKIGG